MKRKTPLIIWDLKTRTIDTQYGVIDYETFCKLEQKRIGKHTQVIEDGKNICLIDDKNSARSVKVGARFGV